MSNHGPVERFHLIDAAHHYKIPAVLEAEGRAAIIEGTWTRLAGAPQFHPLLKLCKSDIG